VEGEALGSLPADGFSLVGGFGTSLLTTTSLGFAVEALVTTGWSNWDTRPFLNSDSDDFDPSMFALTGQLSLHF
jgi:hypothetical protein